MHSLEICGATESLGVSVSVVSLHEPQSKTLLKKQSLRK